MRHSADSQRTEGGGTQGRRLTAVPAEEPSAAAAPAVVEEEYQGQEAAVDEHVPHHVWPKPPSAAATTAALLQGPRSRNLQRIPLCRCQLAWGFPRGRSNSSPLPSPI